MEQPDQPNFQPPPCPLCGADGSHRIWKEVTGHGSGLRVIGSRAHPLLGAQVNALICTSCGNILFFVDPKEL